jgi:peptide/nickel transport system substrate-binding protein
MLRRQFLAGAAAVASMPAMPVLAQPATGGASRTLIHVPQANLTSLDPVWTTATVTRNAAGMIFETLYGRDERLAPKPQMVEADQVDDNGLRWTMRLRQGLLFHDGTPVLARDCVASLKRWMRRDPIGQTIAARLDSLEATDDRTLVWRLRKPFASLPYALAKTQPSPVIMPARLANTDPFKQIPEVIGSGPFRYVPDEYVSGHRAVFAKFDRYSPRDEPVSFTSGGLRVMVDRVEWRIIPDAATAANALVSGEVDWLDSPLPDLLPMLAKSSGVTVAPVDIYGTLGGLRPNHLHGATANPGVRRDGWRSEALPCPGRLFHARHALGQRCWDGPRAPSSGYRRDQGDAERRWLRRRACCADAPDRSDLLRRDEPCGGRRPARHRHQPR